MKYVARGRKKWGKNGVGKRKREGRGEKEGRREWDKERIMNSGTGERKKQEGGGGGGGGR